MIVAIEGIDGCGKSTQAKELARRFKGSGYERVETLHFPDYSTKTGQTILSLLKKEWGTYASELMVESPQIRALVLQSLMTTNRLEHFEMLKRWQLDNEGVLVLDRYYGSGLVYGECDGLDREFLTNIHKAVPAAKFVYLDIPADESTTRRPERRDEYESRPGFMKVVRAKYLEIADLRDWSVVDGVGTVEEVADRVWKAVS